jgi:KDO2-lipid IV(A) lauroyltransferase
MNWLIWFYRITSLLAVILPPKVALFITRLIAEGAYHLTYRNVRPIVEANLSTVVEPDKGYEEINGLVHAVFLKFACFIYEFLRLPWLSKRDLGSRIVTFGIEKIDRALEKGQGVIVLTAHIGNWELGAATLALLGYTPTVVALRYTDPVLNRFFHWRRTKAGLKVCYLDEAPREGLKALRRGGCIAILGDRDYSGTGIEIPFFGRPAKFPTGPVSLATRTGASLIPAFCIFERDCRHYHIYFDDPIDLACGSDKEENLRTNLSHWVRVLERVVAEHPEQWFVFQPVWEDKQSAFRNKR